MCQLLLSGIGYVPTPDVRSDIWDCVESYAIRMFLAHRLKFIPTFSLNSLGVIRVWAGTKNLRLYFFGRYIGDLNVGIVH